VSGLSRTHTQVHDLSRRPSASLRPGSPKKASRRITLPVGCDSESSAKHASPCSAATVRSSQIVDPRQAAWPYGNRSRDRKRSGPMTTLRCRERRIGGTRHPSRPEAATDDQVHARTGRDHIVWSAQQTQPPEGDDRICPKAEARSLAAGIEDTFPRFNAFRRNQMRRSLRWIASPAPSAPRVSHPLSGFIPAHPRGYISSHIHP
jgi:hypothetical protein